MKTRFQPGSFSDLSGYTSTNDVDLTNDKDHLKKVLSKAGIPTPEHAKIRTRSELESFLSQYREVVAKPSRGGTGSAGVVRIARGSSLTEEDLRTIREQSVDGTILAETYLQGREFSVDGYVQNRQPVILSIADKYTGVSSKSFAIEGFATSRLASPDQPTAALEKLSVEVVAALDIDDSFFSIDAIYAEGELFVLDVGLLLDAKIDRLLAIAGLDVYQLLVRLATGEKLSSSAYRLPNGKGFALRFLYADRKGELLPRIGYELNDRLAIEWERVGGDQVQPPRSVADTVGWLTSEREDRMSAWKSVLEARAEEFFQIRE